MVPEAGQQLLHRRLVRAPGRRLRREPAPQHPPQVGQPHHPAAGGALGLPGLPLGAGQGLQAALASKDMASGSTQMDIKQEGLCNFSDCKIFLIFGIYYLR